MMPEFLNRNVGLTCLMTVIFAHADGALAQIAVDWSAPVEYDTGIDPAVAARSGFVVEVHRTDSSDSNPLHHPGSNQLYYHVGKLDGDRRTVTWGPSHSLDTAGNWPAVALTAEGYVVITWSTSTASDNSQLAYRVGTVDLRGDVNQSINFRTGASTVYDTGFCNSISVNRRGVIAEAHEAGNGHHGIFYRLAHLKNPLQGDFSIVWDTGDHGVKYNDGVHPRISINDNNDVVEVHQVPNESLLHYIRGTARTSSISFNDEKPRYDNHAVTPAAVLLNNSSLVELHVSSTETHYRTGVLALENPWEIRWSDGVPLSGAGKVDSPNPAVASDDPRVIAVFTASGTRLDYVVANAVTMQ